MEEFVVTVPNRGPVLLQGSANAMLVTLITTLEEKCVDVPWNAQHTMGHYAVGMVSVNRLDWWSIATARMGTPVTPVNMRVLTSAVA